MKMVKSLLLGSAAGLVAMAGAQAADLPVKAKPVQYVKICSLYGVGFYYVPGTDMCLKVGGWARFETAYGYNGSLTGEWWNNDLNNRSTSDNPYRVKGIVSLDARSPTDYGTVRSYVSLGVSTSQNGNGVGCGIGGVTSSCDGVANYANRWFIQWAGFTVGRSTSFYDFYSIGANQYGYAGASSDTGDGGWLTFGYTATFGNGLSASLAVEEQRRTTIINASAGIGPGTVSFFEAAPGLGGALLPLVNAALGSNYEGHDYPDVVANLRVTQAWGSAQIMGALHNVASTYYGASLAAQLEGNGHAADKLGFATGFGFTLNAPMIGPGDYFSTEFDYAQGASRYTNHTAGLFSYVIYHGNSIGYGLESDAVYATGTNLELTTTWQAVAAYTHNWNPAWKSTLWGSYRATDYNANANSLLCGGAAQVAAGCDNDWSMWGVGLRTQWAVSSTFQIGLETVYAKLHSAQSVGGLITQATANGTKAACAVGVLGAGCYTVDDQNNWAVRLRVNRDFYP